MGGSLVARRNSQLVTAHLENISRRALEKYERIIRRFVRKRQGIYALYHGNKLYYVGLASNLRSRLAIHLRDRHAKTWDRFSVYMTIGDHHLKELESLAIRISRPRGNRARGNFARSENLKREFRNEIRRFQQAEMKSIFGLGRIHQSENGVSPGDKATAVLAKYVRRSFKIRYLYKGKHHNARVLSNGWIRYNGHRYRSPSSAAFAVTRKPTDGWITWRYERTPGDWVPIDTLRK